MGLRNLDSACTGEGSMQKSCGVCGGNAHPHWEKLSFWKCASCGWMFRDPCPTADELGQLYNSSWRAPEKNRRDTGGTNANLSRECASRLAASVGVKDFRGLRLLDFGAGKGEMMRVLQEMGADVYGVEPFGHDFLVTQGLKAFHTLDEIPSEIRFDGILTSDVIEHLRTPWDEIAQLRDRLKDSGWVYLSTPNADGLSAKLRREQWKEAGRPGHIVFFTSGSLKRTLERTGYSECRRLKWFVNYRAGAFRRGMHYMLQSCAMDGELRYLAFKQPKKQASAAAV